MPNPEWAAREITKQLVGRQMRLDADSIVFLRKAIGLKTAELAHVLKVSRVTISRWENGHTNIDPLNDWKLRLEAIDILPPAERSTCKDEVVMLFRRSYQPDSSVKEEKLEVRRPRNHESVEMACVTD